MELVFVVDADTSFRAALARLFDAEGLAVRPCARVEEALAYPRDGVTACLVVDLSRGSDPEQEVGSALGRMAEAVPIVAIGASDDVRTLRLARRIGARVFFRKPIDGSALVDAVRWALHLEVADDSKRAYPAPGAAGATGPNDDGADAAGRPNRTGNRSPLE